MKFIMKMKNYRAKEFGILITAINKMKLILKTVKNKELK